MVSRRPSSTFQFIALWFAVLVLTLITAIAALSSHARADCAQSLPQVNVNTSPTVNITAGSPTCSPREDISAFVRHYTSYFQSAHIVIVQATVSLSLLVFQPALRAMTWTALDAPLTLGALQRSIELAGSPSLMSAVLYVKTLGSMPPLKVVFVLLVNTLSLLSPLAISAVYRSHTGPHTVSASFVVGGGVGPDVSSSLGKDAAVGGGIIAGRALINARTISNISTPDVAFAPFIPQDSVLDIWSTQLETVVARQTLDCGPSARTRVWPDSGSIITLGPTYFSSDLAQADVSFAGQALGYISNDPHVTAVYINSSTASTPGSVEAQSTVIFLAANGTMEGAQERIISPTPLSRIAYIDVLICTSTARLDINLCNVERGAFANCYPTPAPQLPPNASTSPTGGVEAYIKNPIATSITLSASPVMACYQLSDRLPMWNYITNDLLASRLPPLSFLSSDIPAPPYSIPLAYVGIAFFGQTAQALVQGMTTVWQVYNTQPVQLAAVFATSVPGLLYVLTGAVALCALIATCGSRAAGRDVGLGAAQLIYVSRGGEMAEVLEGYTDSNGELLEKVQGARVRLDRDQQALCPWSDNDMRLPALRSAYP